MRCWLSLLILASALAAQPITDQQIRDEANRLVASAAQEPPLLALDTLLRTATLIRPYLEQDSQRMLRQAVAYGAKHPEIAMSYSTARLWMDLDPNGGEAAMRKLTDRRRVLQALSAFYMRKNPEHSIDLAVEALRLAPERKSETPGLMQNVAEARPLLVVELLQLPHIQKDNQYPLTFIQALEGLQRAAVTKPAEVKKAADQLEPLVRRDDFAKGSTMFVSIRRDGPGQADSRSALLEMLDLARKLADEKTRAAAQAVVNRQFTDFNTKGAARPPVDGNLAFDQALAEIQKSEPAYQRLGELWRYLQGRQRPVEEDRAILVTMIEWALNGPTRSDPVWFVQSLLNLDGRLWRGPKRQWQLAAELRPMVFAGAARASQRMDNNPDQLAELVAAMAAEKVPASADLPSAKNRLTLHDLRARMEARYDFSLPGLDKTSTGLQGLRGKAVVLNFWSTTCGPCRAEMPMMERLSKEFGNDLQVLAITEESPEKVSGYLAKNPIGLRILTDQQGDVMRHFMKVNIGYPQTVVLNRDGLWTQHFPGLAKEDEFRAAVRAALAH